MFTTNHIQVMFTTCAAARVIYIVDVVDQSKSLISQLHII